MIKTLNIVNGDACIGMMKKAGIEGDFLPWRDFLHEGPVLPYLSLDKLSKLRAQFISDYGLGEFKELYREFKARNDMLASYQKYNKVTLWFEHDLYDQLQLLQVLAWFADQNLEKTTLTLVCTNHYLGESSPKKIKKLLNYETSIVKDHLTLAKKAWLAFCHHTPERWEKLLHEQTALLPFLKAAVYRMLEEFPNTKCGLSRTEYQALRIIANGMNNPLDILNKYQSFEERKFMGDVIFWKILESFEEYKLIRKDSEQKILITPLGIKLLKSEENWLNIRPMQRFIGGVSLNAQKVWCWDPEKKEIKAYYYSKTLNALLKIK